MVGEAGAGRDYFKKLTNIYVGNCLDRDVLQGGTIAAEEELKMTMTKEILPNIFKN